jgi:xanthine/CO dehydrogenase XdhC/CoxF family maturation factor
MTEFGMIDEAVGALPETIVERVGRVRVRLEPDPGFGSHWRRTMEGLEITVATDGVEEHDVAMEVLLCVGQALWEVTTPAEREAWLRVIGDEIEAGVEGEIDEDALAEKRALLGGPVSAASQRRLLRYAGASFASTVAEYVHSRWHEVTVVEGPEQLPEDWLRRRWQVIEKLSRLE